MFLHSRYAQTGRNLYEDISKGSITIKNGDATTTYDVSGGDIVGFTTVNGKKKTIVQYGVGEKIYEGKKLVEETAYRPNSNCARIEKGVWKKGENKIGDYEVKYERKTYGGGFKREIVKYKKNNKLAYSIGYGKKNCEILYPNGKLWVDIKGRCNFAYRDSLFLNDYNRDVFTEFENGTARYNDYIRDANFDISIYDLKGKVRTQGKTENRQRIGVWTEDYKTVYYLQGVVVSKKLFDGDISAQDVLEVKNAQLRSSLLGKIGIDRVVHELKGNLIHQDGDCQLLSFKLAPTGEHDWNKGDDYMVLLKVRCPSTQTYYTLRVPPTMETCEQARVWTFGQDENTKAEDKIEFLKET